MKTGRRGIVRTVVQLAVLAVLVTPAGAEPLELFGYAGVMGEWELTASVSGERRDEGSRRADDHDACRDLHRRSSGRKERRNPRADLAPCVANIGDAVIRRRRVHIQRPAFGFLFGNDELPDGIRTAEDLAEVANQWPCTLVMPALVAGIHVLTAMQQVRREWPGLQAREDGASRLLPGHDISRFLESDYRHSIFFTA